MAFLERLAQHFEAAALKLRQLVEEEHADVSQFQVDFSPQLYIRG